MGGVVSAVVGAVGDAVGAVGGAVSAAVSAVGGAIGGGLSSVGEAIGGPLGGVVQTIGQSIRETVGGVIDNVSRTVARAIRGVGETIGGFINTAVVTVVEVVSTVGGFVVDLFESTVGWVLDIAGAVIEVIFSIPVFGAILRDIWHIVETYVGVVLSIPDIILGILGIFPEKRMRIVVIVQRDEHNRPLVGPDVVLPVIQRAIDVFKAEANVRILPVGPFKFSSPFQDKPTGNSNYIFVEDSSSDGKTLDVNCGLDDFVTDLGMVGTTFNLKLTVDQFFTNARRVIGYGAPVACFTVRSFDGTMNGCSLGPLTDYVTVKFSVDKTRVLAHELGHACNLKHDSDADNLMNPKGQGNTLGRFQKIILRTSRHVTYF
jgi:hypothetical protein